MCYGAVLNIFAGVKESDTGLASANLWDWAADMQRMEEEHPKDIPCKSHVAQRSFHTSPTEGSVRTWFLRCSGKGGETGYRVFEDVSGKYSLVARHADFSFAVHSMKCTIRRLLWYFTCTSSFNPLSYVADLDNTMFPLSPTVRSMSSWATTLLSSSSKNVDSSDGSTVKLPFDNSSTVKLVPVVIFPTFTEFPLCPMACLLHSIKQIPHRLASHVRSLESLPFIFSTNLYVAKTLKAYRKNFKYFVTYLLLTLMKTRDLSRTL